MLKKPGEGKPSLATNQGPGKSPSGNQAKPAHGKPSPDAIRAIKDRAIAGKTQGAGISSTSGAGGKKPSNLPGRENADAVKRAQDLAVKQKLADKAKPSGTAKPMGTAAGKGTLAQTGADKGGAKPRASSDAKPDAVKRAQELALKKRLEKGNSPEKGPKSPGAKGVASSGSNPKTRVALKPVLSSSKLEERKTAALAKLDPTKQAKVTEKIDANKAKAKATAQPKSLADNKTHISGKIPPKPALSKTSTSPLSATVRKTLDRNPSGLGLTSATAKDFQVWGNLSTSSDSVIAGIGQDALNHNGVLSSPEKMAQVQEILGRTGPNKPPPDVAAALSHLVDRTNEMATLQLSLSGGAGGLGGLGGGASGLGNLGAAGDPGATSGPGGIPGGILQIIDGATGGANTGGPAAGIAGGILQIIDGATGGQLGLPAAVNSGPSFFVGSGGGGFAGGGGGFADPGAVTGMFMSVDDGPCDDEDEGAVGIPVAVDNSSEVVPVSADVADADRGVVPLTAVMHKTRFFRVANASREKITLFLRYYTEDETGKWSWSPETPEKSSTEPLAYELEPGEAADVTDSDWRINASKVRVWAKATSGKEWVKYKDTDLPLVTTVDENGEYAYVSPEKGTFNFTVK